MINKTDITVNIFDTNEPSDANIHTTPMINGTTTKPDGILKNPKLSLP